jgi:hypothetical protein
MRKKIIYSGFTRSWIHIKQNQEANIICPEDDLFFYTDRIPEGYAGETLGPQLTEYPMYYRSRMAPETSIINTLNQWRNRQRAFFLSTRGIGTEDVYIINRCDIALSAKPDYKISPGVIYIPHKHDYNGICDQFAYGDYAAMKFYCDMYDYIDHYWTVDGIKFHPETLLKHHLRNTMVVRFPQEVQIFRL